MGMETNIVLIGYMASGKTSVGKELANITGMTLLDTDNLIENKYRMSIKEMFAKYGEEYFRNAETEILKEMLKENRKCIISTGGGMPVKEENREYLKELGEVIYLKTNATDTIRRTKMDVTRPLLKGSDEEKINKMLEYRVPIYTEIADYIIDSGKNDVSTVTRKIIKYMDEKGI